MWGNQYNQSSNLLDSVMSNEYGQKPQGLPPQAHVPDPWTTGRKPQEPQPQPLPPNPGGGPRFGFGDWFGGGLSGGNFFGRNFDNNDNMWGRMTPWNDEWSGGLWDRSFGKHGMGGHIGNMWDSQVELYGNMDKWNLQHNPVANMWDNSVGALGKGIGNFFSDVTGW